MKNHCMGILMSKFQISSFASRKVSESIIITGAARSGTTILGKIFHSLEKIEYCFEPPSLFSLIPQIHQIPQHTWKVLYETYLYEDFLIPALAGRNINFNTFDDSSIYNTKSDAEIKFRISKSWSKYEIEKKFVESARICYKMPDILPFIPLIQSYYPTSDIIIIIRDPLEIINSIYNKHWFTDNNLKGANLIWPFMKIKDYKVPFWVKENQISRFCDMSEIDRCAYYVLNQYKYLKDIKSSMIINYQDLLYNTSQIVDELCLKYNLKYGSKTKSIISLVSPQGTKLNISKLDGISQSLSIELEEIYKCQSMS